MTAFANIQDGETFVWGDLMYMKIPPAPVGTCDSCGVGINALAIGRQDGATLKDHFGYPKLPWGTHFCPREKVKAR